MDIMKRKEVAKLKPMIFCLFYNEETEEKAKEIFNEFRKSYRLNHYYKNDLKTPLFELKMLPSNDDYIVDNFDVAFIPEGYIIEDSPNTRIIYYNPEEEIKLWEQ